MLNLLRISINNEYYPEERYIETSIKITAAGDNYDFIGFFQTY
jgi:hypothetical protein